MLFWCASDFSRLLQCELPTEWFHRGGHVALWAHWLRARLHGTGTSAAQRQALLDLATSSVARAPKEPAPVVAANCVLVAAAAAVLVRADHRTGATDIVPVYDALWTQLTGAAHRRAAGASTTTTTTTVRFWVERPLQRARDPQLMLALPSFSTST